MSNVAMYIENSAMQSAPDVAGQILYMLGLQQREHLSNHVSYRVTHTRPVHIRHKHPSKAVQK